MNYTISMASTMEKFSAKSDQMILDSALDAGIKIPYGCKNGVCGACKCKVLQGDVTHEKFNNAVLDEAEQKAKFILSCKAIPQSDLILEVPKLEHSTSLRIFQAKIIHISIYKSVLCVKLKLPFNQKMNFIAGQYIEILHDKGSRFYSIANAPNNNQEISLHIKLYPSGLLAESLWKKASIGDIIRFKGPIGDFSIRKSNAPIIFVCTGTGFAPIKAIYEDLITHNTKQAIYLIWGNKRVEDFYELDIIRQWQQDLNLNVTLCTSQEYVKGFSNSRVTQSIGAISSNLKDYQIYACGSSSMVEDLYLITTNKFRLDPLNFYSDIFYSPK